jgi:hypothetical protein
LNLSDVNRFNNVRTGNSITFINAANFNFKPQTGENSFLKNFTGTKTSTDAAKAPFDVLGTNRNTVNVTAGAYEF